MTQVKQWASCSLLSRLFSSHVSVLILHLSCIWKPNQVLNTSHTWVCCHGSGYLTQRGFFFPLFNLFFLNPFRSESTHFFISKQLISWLGRHPQVWMSGSALMGSICWLLITASWGLLGAVSTLRKASSIPLYLQAGDKSPAAHAVIQQEQLVTDSTFRETVGSLWKRGDNGPTLSDASYQVHGTFFPLREKKDWMGKREICDHSRGKSCNSWLSLASHFKKERWGKGEL